MVTLQNKFASSVDLLDKIFKNCSACSTHDFCLPNHLNESDTRQLDRIVLRKKIARNGFLYRIGDTFVSLYAIRIGHFKSYHENLAGDRQITGFQMSGELLGLDAIGSGQYQSDAVALDDSEVCIIPFQMLEALFSQMPHLAHQFHCIMSKEIADEQKVLMLLGNLRSEQRFAAFILNLSSRYVVRGYSATQFTLRMTREDIGNYLGLTIESISRIISKMRAERIINIQQRNVEILDLPKLKKLAEATISLSGKY